MTVAARHTAMRGALVFAVAVGLVALVAQASPADAGTLKKGDRLVELDVAVDAKGKPVKLKAMRGTWVLVTAGASWCVPCKKELPQWDRLAGELGGKVAFVALDLDDDVADGKKFHDKLKLRHMKRVYLPGDKSAAAASYGGATLPSSYVADPQGVIQYVHSGFDDRNADGEYKKMKAVLAGLVK